MNIPVVRQSPPNPYAARENRRALDALGITCVNILGPAGSGKTAVLEAIFPRLRRELGVGIVEAGLGSTSDAQHLASLGVPVVQVLPDGAAQLEAHQVQRGMAELPLRKLELLVIENLGSPFAPPWGNLGEHLRIVVLSIAAGDQVTAKYPDLVQDAALILLNKYDLLPHVRYDLDRAVHALHRQSPGAEVICTDTRNRVGIDRVAGWLLGYVRAQAMKQTRRRHATEPVGAPH